MGKRIVEEDSPRAPRRAQCLGEEKQPLLKQQSRVFTLLNSYMTAFIPLLLFPHISWSQNLSIFLKSNPPSASPICESKQGDINKLRPISCFQL